VTTFADLKTRIADELDRNDINTQIGNEIKRAIKHYEQQRWWFTETQTTITTSSSQASYSLPSNLIILDNVEIQISNNKLEVHEISWNKYVHDWRYSSVPTGHPDQYAYYSDLLWLGPVPNGAYNVTLSIVYKLDELSNDADSNAWTNEAEDLIVSRAERMLGSRLLHLPVQELLLMAQLEREAYNALCGRNEQKVMTGNARPWS